QQPEGNRRRGPPLCVVRLAQTPGLRFVVRLDWRPMPPVRVCVHSVSRPYLGGISSDPAAAGGVFGESPGTAAAGAGEGGSGAGAASPAGGDAAGRRVSALRVVDGESVAACALRLRRAAVFDCTVAASRARYKSTSCSVIAAGDSAM